MRERPPCIEAEEVALCDPATAMAFFDEQLGEASTWPSPLLRYRLSSDFQGMWKAEVGQWLKRADMLGFLDPVVERVRQEAKRRRKDESRGSSDPSHLKLHQHLVEARLAHHLAGMGWQFDAFQAETGGPVDVDIRLRAPDGAPVDIQAKAPGRYLERPGNLKARTEEASTAAGDEGDDEAPGVSDDEAILKAILKARDQLPRETSTPSLIAICPNATDVLSWEPFRLLGRLLGSTLQEGNEVYLLPERRGLMFEPGWSHVSGLLISELNIGLDVETGRLGAAYSAMVVANPTATNPLKLEWFPRARVLHLHGSCFRWAHGEPNGRTTFPDGTVLVGSSA